MMKQPKGSSSGRDHTKKETTDDLSSEWSFIDISRKLLEKKHQAPTLFSGNKASENKEDGSREKVDNISEAEPSLDEVLRSPLLKK